MRRCPNQEGRGRGLFAAAHVLEEGQVEGEPDRAIEEDASSGDPLQRVRSRVDLDESHDNLWKLVQFLSTYRGVVVPAHDFRVATGDQAALLDAMRGQDKEVVLSAVATYLSGELTDADVEMLRDRRKALEQFDALLHDEAHFQHEVEAAHGRPEAVWQAFFEENTWIFGYGLTLVACEAYEDERLEEMTTGRNVFEGAGKRSDALMKTKGFIQTLLFAEIKRHDTTLLSNTPYRHPDVCQPSPELTGAVSQVQKTTHKAVKKLEDLHRQYRDTGEHEFDVSTIRPRQIVVAGQLNQLSDGDEINVEKLTSFELWRRGQLGVEVLTFDELYERTRYIVERQEQ